MKKIILFTIIVTFGVCLSCKDDVLDKVNPNDFSTENYYKTGEHLTAAVNAVYSSLQAHDLYAREYFYTHDMRSDEIQIGGNLEAARQQVLKGELDATNNLSSQVWRGWFRIILQANLVLEHAPNVKESITETLRTRLVGEAKFLRGMAFFDLVVLYGGVPLMTSSTKAINESKPRASESEVYTQIVSDLKDAIASLPNKNEYQDSEIGRASKQAAQTLLARVYMQQGEYALAKEQLLAVANSGLFTNWKNVPYINNSLEETEFNDESIFEVIFSDDFGGTDWNLSVSGQSQTAELTLRGQEYAPNTGGWRNVIPSDVLVAAFEKTSKGDAKDDPRYNDNFYLPGDKFNNGASTIDISQFAIQSKPVSWKKYTKMYKTPTEEQRSGINFRVMRFAEVILNLAECENHLGNDPAAINYLNEVRSRVGVEMPSYPTANYPVNSPSEVFKAIVHERQVEFAGEQIRNRDILRWRKLNKMVINPIPNFNPLLPIPQVELSNNSSMTLEDQNPGY